MIHDSIVGYVAATLMGVVLGLIGAGGSVLTVPILVYLCGVHVVLATTYSLWVVGMTALVGAVRYARLQLISYRVAFLFGAPSLLGVLLSRRALLPRIPQHILQIGTVQIDKDLMLLTHRTHFH